MGYLQFVNVKHGTDSQRRFSSGNTLPLTALPHAMAAFAPQTNGSRHSWFYHPADRSLEGIRLTHQPSPWVGDFSYLCFMPQAERLFETEDLRWSGFRPEEAQLMPHYMDVKFLRYGARLSLAPTDSGAVMQLEFDSFVKQPRFAVLPPSGFVSQTSADTENKRIYGYTTSYTASPYHGDFKCWFVFEFGCDISDVQKGGDSSQKISVALSERRTTVKMATSYISQEQAVFNLESQTKGLDFAAAKASAEDIWEGLLSKVEIESDLRTMRTFYSCMYRAFLYPTKLYETDASGKNLHVVPETGQVKEGVMYTNNGFWDTFRTVYPFYALVIPEKLREILHGYLNFFDDTGFLPRWPSPGEFGCMPGTLIEAVFADAAAKNILDKADLKRSLSALVANASRRSDNPRQGRKCVEEYNQLGYVPHDLCRESVNETLDCAYGDFCIGVVARVAGEEAMAEEFFKRSKNYANLFDSKSGFFRGKDVKGNFREEDFNPLNWGRDYTEGSAWQNSFAVQHDIEGLAELHGGNAALEKKLDELFATPPLYCVGGYDHEIHEMTEMAAVDFGQCAISNQPSFHIPYIYSLIGRRDKTEYWVERIVKELFSPEDNGYPGDEDNGTMACFYIFSCLGLYPLCPGKDEYALSKPLVTIKSLPKGFPRAD